MHRLLQTQIKRIFGNQAKLSKEMLQFVNLIDEAYKEFDVDREKLERSLELSSQELLHANSNMRNIFLAIPDLFFRLDNNGIIIECQARASNDFILEPSRLVGKRIQDIPIKNIGNLFQEAIDTLNKTKSIVNIEYPMTANDCQEYYETRLIPLADNQIIAIIRNITSRKVTEEALKESEERYRIFIDSIPNLVFLKDENLRYINVNESLVKFFGKKDKQEILGKTDDEIMPAHLADRHKVNDVEVLNTKQILINEDQFDDVFLNTIKFPVKLSGNKIGIGGFISDITSRKNTEIEFARQRYLIEQLLDNVPDRIYFKDINSRFLSVSKSFLNVLQLDSLEQLEGKTDFDIYDKEHAEDAFNDEQEIIRTGIPIIGKEEKERLFGNVERWSLTTKMPWRDANGEIKGTFGISTDITSKKHTEEELLRQNYLIDQLMETSPDLIYFKDRTGKFIALSNSFYKRFGVESRGALLGKSDFDLYKEEQARAFFKEEQRIIFTGIPVIDKEEKEIWLNNEVRWNIVSKMPWRNAEGEITGTFGISRDITERKKLEEAIKRSVKNFRKLFESSPYGILITTVGVSPIVLEVNEAYIKIAERKKEELLGKSPVLISDEKNAKFAREEFIHKGKVENFEYIANVAGKSKVILLNSQPIEFDGKPAIFNTLEDITEKRSTEIGLQNAKQFIEYIVNVLPVAIISIDKNFDVTLYNQTALNYAGDNDNINVNPNIFKKFQRLTFLETLLEKSISTQNYVNEVKSVSNEEGNIVYYDVTITPLKSSAGGGSLIMVENITKKKMMDQVMIQSEKMLSIAGLAAGMAHEINNPLGTIVQGCQNILRRVSASLPKNLDTAKHLGIDISIIEEYFKQRQIYDIIDSIHNAAGKAAEIIKNMLQFSRRSESKKVMYSLSKLVDETLELAFNDYDLKKRFDFRRIKFIKEFDESVPETKLTVTEIQQVIFNILQNAAHAIKMENNSSKIPQIILRIIPETHYIRIEIEDNGPGMDEKIRNRIFEPFFTTKDVGEGTGLGLSVSYMIITTNHSGMISVESMLGKGTKFIIKLPV
ncbi:MAG: PAS domain-containing protein [bacterium]